ncbi:MAG: hypothetical protein CVU89_14345 [Firmicutes bacterium HGW-Firmicutes-14]|nr:MAG: hypothetical protein CVU89_14345 [Firmicutes bacterium HGW-Firmicutes-14]
MFSSKEIDYKIILYNKAGWEEQVVKILKEGFAMCNYYFDEDHGIAYKVKPVTVSMVNADEQSSLMSILVHTDVKVTNLKKEKIRRTLSQVYPTNEYDLDAARQVFSDTLLARFISGARRISEQEYERINARFEG